MIINTIGSNDLAQSLNDVNIDRLMAVGMDWKIISWNRSSELSTGIDRKNILGKNLFEVFPELQTDEEIVKAWKKAMEGSKSFLPSVPGLYNRSIYENHFIPLNDGEGLPIGAVNIMHDVTHQIKDEQQLDELSLALRHKYDQLLKANNELATFTSIAGSELKMPIKHIYTSLEIILTKDGQKLSDSSRAGLRRMQSSLNRINLLLDDVLALSSVNSLTHEFSMVNLNTVLDNTLKMLDRKVSERRAAIKNSPLPTIYGSASMLNILFFNIIDNALKFQSSENIPSIIISGQTGVSGNNGETGLVCITFSDNGIGFPQSEGKKIFEMFQRLHQRKDFPGSGIGLTISQKIAEAHEGYIEAESAPGMGTKIRCYLSTSLQHPDSKLS